MMMPIMPLTKMASSRLQKSIARIPCFRTQISILLTLLFLSHFPPTLVSLRSHSLLLLESTSALLTFATLRTLPFSFFLFTLTSLSLHLLSQHISTSLIFSCLFAFELSLSQSSSSYDTSFPALSFTLHTSYIHQSTILLMSLKKSLESRTACLVLRTSSSPHFLRSSRCGLGLYVSN